MVVLWVVMGFFLYIAAGIWFITATANGVITPLHMNSILGYVVTDRTQMLLLESLRVLVGALFFYAVAEYVVHKAMKTKKGNGEAR